MSVAWRLALVVAALIVLVPAVCHVAAALPAFGAPLSHYGATVNAILPSARHVTNMVAAVNFDVRGIDTLGEECILVCAATGTVVLLRGARGEDMTARASRLPGRPILGRIDATIWVSRFAASLILLFGIYMVLHGTVTPGGGFQGGAVMASSFVLVYLGEGYPSWRRLLRSSVLGVLEGGGAFLFVGAAVIPLALGYAALQNILPFGKDKDLFSGGLMLIANFAVALSVIGSFGLLQLEFMEETRSPESDPATREKRS